MQLRRAYSLGLGAPPAHGSTIRLPGGLTLASMHVWAWGFRSCSLCVPLRSAGRTECEHERVCFVSARSQCLCLSRHMLLQMVAAWLRTSRLPLSQSRAPSAVAPEFASGGANQSLRRRTPALWGSSSSSKLACRRHLWRRLPHRLMSLAALVCWTGARGCVPPVLFPQILACRRVAVRGYAPVARMGAGHRSPVSSHERLVVRRYHTGQMQQKMGAHPCTLHVQTQTRDTLHRGQKLSCCQ